MMIRPPKILNVKITGTGSYLPEKVETTEDFVKKGASPEKIDYFGVSEHRVMGENETVTDMEAHAAKKAIKNAGIKPDDVDLIISGTGMPTQIVAPNSNALQHRIGAKNAAAFDVNMACASAIPEIMIAAQFIELKHYQYILLTGSSHLSRIADPTDPASFVVLGDGAGAFVMALADDKEKGILSFDIQTKGEYFNYCGAKVKRPKKYAGERQFHDPCVEKLYFYIGDFDNPSQSIMNYLIDSVPATVQKALEKAGMSLSDIDFLITHQNITPLAGKWIEKLDIPPEKTHLTYSRYGNMTSANIFVNLDEAVRMKKIKEGDIVVFAGQGAGFSVGAIVMRW
ncbi:MAG: ketoacyl-ACP synthase III [Candidatus Schekmanbacteria bacterium]|nr:ketoacyl-ACP synthase III [Candidatus Schekmanbacteria bacterium]